MQRSLRIVRKSLNSGSYLKLLLGVKENMDTVGKAKRDAWEQARDSMSETDSKHLRHSLEQPE